MRDRSGGAREFLGGLSPAQFLKQYWQKQPLLVRRAFPGFHDPITPDELAGLSCEEDVASRLVMVRGGAMPWQVLPGPQRATHLRKLPPSHWTLLVQGVDRFIPGVAALLESFRFIPDWRVDDVMISFAPRGGTVGPHVDNYDVFLLQGQGRRRWRIDPKAPKDLRPGLDLRILKKFHAEEDWILEPGDMLYLPPDLAHYGVALEDGLTYSIGFRAPTGMALLAVAQERLMQNGVPAVFYRDPQLKPARFPGEIPRAALRELRSLLETSLSRLASADFDTLAGEFLTQPKGTDIPDKQRIKTTEMRARLTKGAALVRSPGSRTGFLRQGKMTALFVDGRRFPLGPNLAFAAPILTGARRLPAKVLTPFLRRPGFVHLLATLVSAGAFRLER